MFRRLFMVLICLLCCWFIRAQDIPVTHIYQLDLRIDPSGHYSVNEIKLLTADNPEGYNNQPALINNTLYYSRRLPGQDNTEIYACNPESRVKWRITRTPEDEYSPSIHPDGIHFTCVRVEADDTTQVLWKYPVDRSNGGEPVSRRFSNVGYYDWHPDGHLALFLVGDPNRLVCKSSNMEETETIALGPGRSFHWNDRGALYFVGSYSKDIRYITEYSPSTGASDIIISLPSAVQDFGLDPQGSLIYGEGSELFIFNPDNDLDWKRVLDLSVFGLDNITRVIPLTTERWYIIDRIR